MDNKLSEDKFCLDFHCNYQREDFEFVDRVFGV